MCVVPLVLDKINVQNTKWKKKVAALLYLICSSNCVIFSLSLSFSYINLLYVFPIKNIFFIYFQLIRESFAFPLKIVFVNAFVAEKFTSCEYRVCVCDPLATQFHQFILASLKGPKMPIFTRPLTQKYKYINYNYYYTLLQNKKLNSNNNFFFYKNKKTSLASHRSTVYMGAVSETHLSL